ncbi:unnamed protein product [Rotaria sordida]|nr:unnamed protein product [Rotaria sordida]CAF1306213.1 unnamed protein product [Rotaria sordida]CAF3511776.1 unnamed protein product [Rotaria sordida]CAF3640024.1 unnamed protein product [Rotaria sordida]CAF3694560.1 unnamed protein product [Rotaria sordida]
MSISKSKPVRQFNIDDDQNAMTDFVTEFTTYEAFLDSQISEIDQNYLQDSDIAREFVELGYRGIGHAISRKDFQERKNRAEFILQSRRQGPIRIISDSLTIIEPFAKELALREEANRTTRLLTIIFIRNRNNIGHEISAYIDYAYRLKFEDFTQFFIGQNKLIPLTTDLSFYNWDTHMCTSNDTNNFHLLSDVNGIQFRCEHDRKIVYVDPESKHYGDGTTRTSINAIGYLQIILYDHYLRRKKF